MLANIECPPNWNFVFVGNFNNLYTALIKIFNFLTFMNFSSDCSAVRAALNDFMVSFDLYNVNVTPISLQSRKRR